MGTCASATQENSVMQFLTETIKLIASIATKQEQFESLAARIAEQTQIKAGSPPKSMTLSQSIAMKLLQAKRNTASKSQIQKLEPTTASAVAPNPVKHTRRKVTSIVLSPRQ